MSIVLVAGRAELRAEVCGAYLSGFDTREVPEIKSVSAVRRLAACVVVCLAEVTRADVLALERLEAIYPRDRTVVVARLTASGVSHLSAVPGLIGRVVWHEQVEDQLRQVVGELATWTFLDAAADLVVGLPALPPLVTQFFRVAWTVPRPGSTVGRVLRELDAKESTFRDAWKSILVPARPKDVVDWAIISRAMLLVDRGASWDTAAYRLGVHRRRFRWVAHRLLSVDLAVLDLSGEEWVAEKLKDWLEVEVVRPLTKRAP